MGVDEADIRYHMTRADPTAVAARATERAWVAAETEAAKAAGVPVKIIFVERAGLAQRRRRWRPQSA